MFNLPSSIPIDHTWLPAHIRDEAVGRRYRVRFSAVEKRSLVKKAHVLPSVWCERHIVLPADAPIPGRWRNMNMPHIAGMLDASFYKSVREIVCCWAPQTGKTSMGFNTNGYCMDRYPGNFLCVYPDIKTAKETVTDRLAVMFNDLPRLRSYLTGYDDDFTTTRIKLKHRKIYVGWASSIASMAAKPLPYAVLDEEDKFEWSNKETTPPNLVRKRLTRFLHMSKLWRFSSPSIEAGSIWVALTEECDAIFNWHLQCPNCGSYQVMAFENIKWEGGGEADPKVMEKDKLAWYECVKCSERWDDAMRDRAARAGQWRERMTGLNIAVYLKAYNPRVIGSHMPGWQSPEVPIAKAVAQFIRGQHDFETLKDFNNGFAALPWRPSQHEREVIEIKALRDEVPEGVVPGGGVVSCLTAGIDTQDYSFWYEIRAWGWGVSLDSWQVRAGEVLPFEDLETVLWGSEYRDAEGNQYFVRLAMQDAMGHRTADVYSFCRQHAPKIFPTQGKTVMASPFTWSNIEYYPGPNGQKKPIPGGVRLYRFDTTFFKNDLSNRLDINMADPGAWRFNQGLTGTWAKHMTAEVVDERKGVWVPRHGMKKYNHGWDCSVLNRLAAEVLGVKYYIRPESAPPASGSQGGNGTKTKKRMW